MPVEKNNTNVHNSKFHQLTFLFLLLVNESEVITEMRRASYFVLKIFAVQIVIELIQGSQGSSSTPGTGNELNLSHVLHKALQKRFNLAAILENLLFFLHLLKNCKYVTVYNYSKQITQSILIR